MLFSTIVGIAFFLGWILRPVYGNWKLDRDFRFVAGTLRTFVDGKVSVSNLSELYGPVSDQMRRFDKTIFPRMVELAATQEDMDELENGGKWMNIWYKLPGHHPVRQLFDQKVAKKLELPHRPGHKRCSQCGGEYSMDLRFCPVDGTSLKPIFTIVPATQIARPAVRRSS